MRSSYKAGGVLPHEYNIKVGDICFSLFSSRSFSEIALNPAYHKFISSGIADINLSCRYELPPRINLEKKDQIFDSESLWRFYRTKDGYVFVLGSEKEGNSYSLAFFDKDFSHGEVICSPAGKTGTLQHLLPDPLEYPLGEALMISLLARGRGLMVHACGIIDNGRGYLFAGNSGNGKTTIARLWKDKAQLLNDDRIIIFLRDGCYWMCGTPWHGDLAEVNATEVPIEKIFFLDRSAENEYHNLADTEAATMLLTRSFPPLWSSEGMEYTLGLVGRLVCDVSCYALGFVPDERIVDFVRGID